MAFSKDVLKINPEEVSTKIEEFIRDNLKHYFRKKGIVVGLSGGIDSAVAAALSVRAIGAKRVFSMLLPEKDSNPISREYGRKMADSLGIECTEVELTPMLEALGVYEKRDAVVKKVFPDIKGPYKFRLVLPQDLLDRDRLNVYHLEVLLEDETILSERLSHDDYLELMAANDMKQRLRMMQLYYEAERRHCIVCGTTNLSETIQGFFVKFGDGGVDIEPLAYLYKNQIFELARYLKIPEEIIARTPSPDTYSFPVSDKDFYFCLPYDQVDYLLYGIENNIPKNEIGDALGLNADQVERAWKDLIRKREATRHLREIPPAPEFTF
jgi:NAD+ synthase